MSQWYIPKEKKKSCLPKVTQPSLHGQYSGTFGVTRKPMTKMQMACEARKYRIPLR